MQLSKLLWLILSMPLVKGHPLDLRFRSLSTTATASTVIATATTSTSVPIVTSVDETFNLLFEGNQMFRNNTAFEKELSEGPKVMFIGCSDNRLSPSTIFQAQMGSITSQVNLANQFSGRDMNANAAVAYAVHNLGVKHIIVMGHYGCKGVHTAMTSQTMAVDKAVEPWLKPVQEIFSKSKRVEIKKLRDSMKEKTRIVVTKDDDPGFRALVEENVRENVKRLMNESVLSTIYRKKKNKKGKDVEVYVHGFVFNEENGEVKDVGVTFGPGQSTFKKPFSVLPKAKLYRKWGKWKAKAKKLAPTPTTTSAPASNTAVENRYLA